MYKYILLVLVCLFISCSTCKEERRAHIVAGNRHIPYLIKAYEKDPELQPLLKTTLIKSAEEWYKLILSREEK